MAWPTSASPAGHVLEPGFGWDNIIAFPGSAEVTGVELDLITEWITAAPYPHARILAEAYAWNRARRSWNVLLTTASHHTR